MIRFYDNVLDTLISSPNIFAGDIFAVLVDTYEFDSNDSFGDIGTKVSTPILVDGTRHEYNSSTPDSIFFIASPVTFEHVVASTSFTGIVFIDDNSNPLFYMDDIPGLPGISLGGDILLSFSTNANKLFRVDTLTNQYYSGSHIIWPKKPIIAAEVPSHISRPGGDISYGDVVIKSSGKSGVYRDLSISGIAHPLTGDITTVTDVSSINQALRLLLLTDVGERPFSSIDIAGNVRALLFELSNDTRAIETQLALAITNYEPRIILNRLRVIELPERNALDISIEYTIKSTGQYGSFSHAFKRA